jgi:hypothetical protein
MYYVGSAKQAADYETTTDYLINFIKRTFDFGNDIGTALENLEEFDILKYKPVLYYSYSDNKEAKDSENLSCTFRSEFRQNSDFVGISGNFFRNPIPIGIKISLSVNQKFRKLQVKFRSRSLRTMPCETYTSTVHVYATNPTK